MKLYHQGVERLNKSLDIVSIIYELRNFKILMENSVLTDEVKESILHSKNNLIILDEDVSSSISDSE